MVTGYDCTRLETLLPPGHPLVVEEAVDSTNRMARELAVSGADSGTVVLADHQTAGRGREGRGWDSPPGVGIWMSVITRPELTPDVVPLLPLASGAAVADAIESQCAARVGLKWPNDVLIGDRKVAGILVESSTQGSRLAWAVIGMGVNVLTERAAFPPDIREIATSLRLEGESDLSREVLVAAMVAALHTRIGSLATYGPGPVVAAFAGRDALRGHVVEVDVPGEGRMRGHARGIAADGRLRVITDSGEVGIRTGSVRKIDP